MELQDLLPAAVSVVAPAQADDPLPESEQPLVGQRDAVRVAREVFEDLARSREGFLGVDDPVVLPEISKRHVRRETGLVSKRALQEVEVFAAEDTGQSAHRKEEVPVGGTNPASTCGIEATRREHAVQVDVKGEVLAPGVKDRDHARLGTEVLRVASEGEQGLGRGPEQEIVDQVWMAKRDGIQQVRQGEDDVEVVDREKLLEASLEPSLLGQGLALGTVAVAAGAPDCAFLTTIRTDLPEPPEGRSPTSSSFPHQRQLHFPIGLVFDPFF